MSIIQAYTVAIVHAGLLPALASPLIYLRSPWRSTAIGRALMMDRASLGALFLVGIIGLWWPFPGYAYIYAAVVTAVVIAISFQTLVMWRMQRKGRNLHTSDGEF